MIVKGLDRAIGRLGKEIWFIRVTTTRNLELETSRNLATLASVNKQYEVKNFLLSTLTLHYDAATQSREKRRAVCNLKCDLKEKYIWKQLIHNLLHGKC